MSNDDNGLQATGFGESLSTRTVSWAAAQDDCSDTRWRRFHRPEAKPHHPAPPAADPAPIWAAARESVRVFTLKVDRAGRMFPPGLAPGTLTTFQPVTRGVAVMRRSSTGAGAPLDSRGRLTLPPGLRVHRETAARQAGAIGLPPPEPHVTPVSRGV